MLFLFDTGLRISEALSVTVEGLDTGNSLVTVFGKGGKTRTVAYGYRTSRALKDYLRWDRPDFETLSIRTSGALTYLYVGSRDNG